MKKINNKKGFTLAELLIVVAIIAVLAAISIPIFNSQLSKAKEATNTANARSLYATLVADYLDNNKIDGTLSGTSLNGEGKIAFGDNVFEFNDQVTSLTISTSDYPTVTLNQKSGASNTFGTTSSSSGE